MKKLGRVGRKEFDLLNDSWSLIIVFVLFYFVFILYHTVLRIDLRCIFFLVKAWRRIIPFPSFCFDFDFNLIV